MFLQHSGARCPVVVVINVVDVSSVLLSVDVSVVGQHLHLPSSRTSLAPTIVCSDLVSNWLPAVRIDSDVCVNV